MNLSIDNDLINFVPLIKGIDDVGDNVDRMNYLSYDPQKVNSKAKKYAGIKYEDYFIIIAYDDTVYKKNLEDIIIRATKNRRIGEKGSLMVVNNSGVIIVDELGYKGKNISEL